ncbi:MAG: CPBP family intramembrane metalloprotease [Sedimentisphaerales bacterium]|nr:CPBP family intramembrane metalloprotease [Sedimentisphaerales bacterium]
MNNLEFAKYIWYSASLALLLAWICHKGWRFGLVAGAAPKTPGAPYAPDQTCAPNRSDGTPTGGRVAGPQLIRQETPSQEGPSLEISIREEPSWQGFELLDVLLVILVYFMTEMVRSRLVGVNEQSALAHPKRYYSALLAGQLVIAGVILGLVRLRGRGGWQRFGLRSDGGLGTMARAVAFFFVATGLTLFTLDITIIICQSLGSQEIQKHYILKQLSEQPSFWSIAVIAATAAIGAPLAEEFIFRGVLQTFFRRLFSRLGRRSASQLPEASNTVNAADVIPDAETAEAAKAETIPNRSCTTMCRWLGIITASGLWALLHPGQHIPALFVLGLCLGYLYEAYRNLLIPIFVHSMFNILPLVFTIWKING